MIAWTHDSTSISLLHWIGLVWSKGIVFFLFYSPYGDSSIVSIVQMRRRINFLIHTFRLVRCHIVIPPGFDHILHSQPKLCNYYSKRSFKTPANFCFAKFVQSIPLSCFQQLLPESKARIASSVRFLKCIFILCLWF